MPEVTELRYRARETGEHEGRLPVPPGACVTDGVVLSGVCVALEQVQAVRVGVDLSLGTSSQHHLELTLEGGAVVRLPLRGPLDVEDRLDNARQVAEQVRAQVRGGRDELGEPDVIELVREVRNLCAERAYSCKYDSPGHLRRDLRAFDPVALLSRAKIRLADAGHALDSTRDLPERDPDVLVDALVQDVYRVAHEYARVHYDSDFGEKLADGLRRVLAEHGAFPRRDDRVALVRDVLDMVIEAVGSQVGPLEPAWVGATVGRVDPAALVADFDRRRLARASEPAVVATIPGGTDLVLGGIPSIDDVRVLLDRLRRAWPEMVVEDDVGDWPRGGEEEPPRELFVYRDAAAVDACANFGVTAQNGGTMVNLLFEDSGTTAVVDDERSSTGQLVKEALREVNVGRQTRALEGSGPRNTDA